jgi:prefoldin alpha subunit
MPELTKEEGERLQRLASELNAQELRAEALRQQLSVLTRSLSEYSVAAETLRGLQNEPEGKEGLVSVGAGCYIPARLKTGDRVILGLGAGVMVEKTLGEATQFLEGKMKELQEAIQKTREELEKVSAEAERLRPELERLLEKTRS